MKYDITVSRTPSVINAHRWTDGWTGRHADSVVP